MSDSPAGVAGIDQLLADLAAGEKAWASADLARRRSLLQEVHAAVAANAADWVRTACEYKRIPADSQTAGEEWMSGPYGVLTGAATLIDTLSAVAAGRSPVDGYRFRDAPGGRVRVRVLPHNQYDVLLLNGFGAEVWIQPGVAAESVRSGAGLGQLHPAETGGIGVVLGAGNITSIPILDVFYELFAHNRVVVLKLNPVTAAIQDVFQRVLRPLIDFGAVRVVTGGADVGGYLVNHPQVSHVHLTGSARTHDAIVWGADAASAGSRKQAGTPLLDKPVTSELGGVSPIIVVPGKWSTADLKFQAENVVTQRLHNGGYNCIAGQVVVLSSDWPQKAEFLAAVRSVLAAVPDRAAWYPGSDDRVAAACSVYPAAYQAGGRVLITGLDESRDALTTEYFAPVLAVLEVPGTGRAFLDAAVRLANEEFAGTLGANLIADPRTIRALGPGFESAIAALRYGTIAVNTWTALGFLTPAATWGAFAGHTLSDVGSGIGIVHNALLLPYTERTVVHGPFRPAPRSLLSGSLALSPRPPWFVTNRTAATTGRLLTGFAARPRASALPAIFASAMRG